MKRFLCILLSLLLVATAIPYNVLAAETNTSERDELIELACEVFPEYEDTIRGNITTTYNRSRANRSVLFNETRKISETQSLTYSQLSDGTAILSSSDYSFNYLTSDTDIESETNVIKVTLNVTVTCTASDGVFILSNVKYTTYKNTYDSITSKGSPSTNQFCMYDSHSYRYDETSTQSAFIYYRITFQLSEGSSMADGVQAGFTLSVRNDGMNISLVNVT